MGVMMSRSGKLSGLKPKHGIQVELGRCHAMQEMINA